MAGWKLSNEFSWTSIRTLGALSKLDEFLQNQHVRVHSGTIPGTFRKINIENREPTEDRSQNNPGPEVDASFFQTVHSMNSDRGDTTHKVKGVHKETPYCYPWDFSGKQKKARSSSQPPFRSENNPETIEADHQMLMVVQQLARNNNSAKISKNISRISKLSKLLTMTMPTFEGKSKKLELSEDLFQTGLHIHSQPTKEEKISCFHSLMHGDTLQTFKNISSPTREILGEILVVFNRQYVKMLNGYSKAQVPKTNLQSREPEAN